MKKWLKALKSISYFEFEIMLTIALAIVAFIVIFY